MESRSTNNLLQAQQICYIISPSGKEQNTRNLLSLLENDTSNSLVSTLYYIFKNGLDITKGSIPALNLICCDINVYFDTLFQDYAITTYSGPENAKKALIESSGIVIFSNDTQEVKKIYDEIQSLSNGNPSPFIFIATTSKDKFDSNGIDTNITQVILCDEFPSKGNALLFWQAVRDKLDNLADMKEEFNQKNEKKCYVM